MNLRFHKRIAWLVYLIACMSMLLSPLQQNAQADENKRVVVIPVEQGIESGLEGFLNRAFITATEQEADVVILDIDTPGGEVGAASNIGHLVREAPMEVIAFIDNQAFSAGTYIALNADLIVMTPGSSIGAAAPIDRSGNATDIKMISAWSEKMVAAAQLNNRSPEIARAMVEINADIPGVKEKGTVLSLDATKAKKFGYADRIVKDKMELYQIMGIKEDRVIAIEPTLSEKVARFVTNPTVMSLLFIIGLVGLIAELLIPGFGVYGTLGLLSFSLYFFGHYVAGFANLMHIGLFLLGVILLILEIFLPGGIVGILGFISMVSGIILAAYDTSQGALSLGIASVVAMVAAYLLVRFFGVRGLWTKFILRTELRNDEGYVAPKDQRELLNQLGVAITPLRPAGIVKIDGKRIDAVSVGGFINAGSSIVVIQVEGTRVVVQEQDNEVKE